MKRQFLIIFGLLLFNYSISSASNLDAVIMDCDYSSGYDVSSYTTSEQRNPEIHIFGVYQTHSDHSFGVHPQGTANIYIERKGVPLIIVLSSYEPVLWKIHKGEDVNISHIILNGYHPHEIEGATGIQVTNRSGPENCIVATSFKWMTEETKTLVSEVESFFSEPIASYNGCYDASSFKITGEVFLPPPRNLSFINILLKKE